MSEFIPSFDVTQAKRIEAPDTREIKKSLSKEIKGQDEAVEAWANILHRVLAGTPKLRKGPLAVITEIGPSGTGKTEIVIQAARFLADQGKKTQATVSRHQGPSVLRIDCGEFQQEHEVSKVIGSPSGYVGRNETPRLSQSEIDKYSIQLDKKRKVTILLLDEIEKAHPKLNVTFMGALDYGVITLGDNQKVNLEDCIVVFTSNLGNKEISKAEKDAQAKGQKPLGTDAKRKHRFDAMRKHFNSEQLSRMGGETNTVCFNELSREVVADILISKLSKLEKEYAKHGRNITFQVTPSGLENILNMGYSSSEGVRRLEIVLEQQVISRLTTLEETDQEIPVIIDADKKSVALYVPNPEQLRIRQELARRDNERKKFSNHSSIAAKLIELTALEKLLKNPEEYDLEVRKMLLENPKEVNPSEVREKILRKLEEIKVLSDERDVLLSRDNDKESGKSNWKWMGIHIARALEELKMTNDKDRVSKSKK